MKVATLPFISICLLLATVVNATADEVTEAKAISIAEATCASLNQKHSQKPPHASLERGFWSIEWPSMEGSGDYPIVDVNEVTGKASGCVEYNIKPFYGPIPSSAKPNMPLDSKSN